VVVGSARVAGVSLRVVEGEIARVAGVIVPAVGESTLVAAVNVLAEGESKLVVEGNR
jgi:ABC-type cobalamin transport system ATPase subunit